MARNYHNIEVYHLAYDFVVEIFKQMKNFPKEEHNIISQMKRAALSIPLNFAEGSAKASNREFAYHLNIAYASAKEVEVLLQLSQDLNCFNGDTFVILSKKLDELNAKLFLFVRNIEARLNSRRFEFFKKVEEKVNPTA